MLTEPSAVWEVLHNKHDSLFADRVMKEEDWERLRKSTHRHRLQPIKLAKVMFGYFWILLYVAALSVAVGVYYKTLVRVYNWPMLSLQSVQTFFSAVTFALTLLLVFKTNSSYARWWEARKDVGQLVSLAHNIARQAVAYFPAQQTQLTHAMGRWVSAVMWVVKSTVRPAAPRQLRDELQGVLLPHELEWLLAQPHKPLALGQALSSIVAAADIDPMAKSRMDQMITLYTFEFGACGRIYNTAIPFCYTRHTSRFLMCYLTVLPLLLWPMSGWASPVLAVIIAFLLLGVENIGAFIEEPFHVIAFDAFCSAVHRDIQNILKMHSSVANVPVIGGLNCPGPTDLDVSHHSHTLSATPTATPRHHVALHCCNNNTAASGAPAASAGAGGGGAGVGVTSAAAAEHAAVSMISHPASQHHGTTADTGSEYGSYPSKLGKLPAAAVITRRQPLNLHQSSNADGSTGDVHGGGGGGSATATAGLEIAGPRRRPLSNCAPAGPVTVINIDSDCADSNSSNDSDSHGDRGDVAPAVLADSSSAACLLSMHEQQQQQQAWHKHWM